MVRYAAFFVLSVACVLIGCIYVWVSNRRIKSKLTREAKYSKIMSDAAMIEHTYYVLCCNHEIDIYPEIKKYLSQSRYMLEKGIPLYASASLTRLPNKDKALNRLIGEIESAPEHIRMATFQQAELMSRIVEAKNPILSRIENVKKNTRVRILLYFIKLIVILRKWNDNSRISELEVDNKIISQSQQIQSAACPDGC